MDAKEMGESFDVVPSLPTRQIGIVPEPTPKRHSRSWKEIILEMARVMTHEALWKASLCSLARDRGWNNSRRLNAQVSTGLEEPLPNSFFFMNTR
jgi:hypothetical protein